MYVLLIVVCSFVLFLLAIVLSVLLRYADSDYPFGIFKLFLILWERDGFVSMQSVSITTDVVSSSVNIMEAILLSSMTVK